MINFCYLVPTFRPPSASQSPPAQPMPGVPPAPSFFANPFMAPFMPQNETTQPLPYQPECFDGNGSSPPSVTPEAALPTSGAEFRVNPLTGGYFLSPGQYQEMMQQYVQSLMLAASAAPPTVGDQSFNELKDDQNIQVRIYKIHNHSNSVLNVVLGSVFLVSGNITMFIFQWQKYIFCYDNYGVSYNISITAQFR